MAFVAYWVMFVVSERSYQVVALWVDSGREITFERHIEVVPIALKLTSHFLRRKDVIGDFSSFTRCHHS